MNLYILSIIIFYSVLFGIEKYIIKTISWVNDNFADLLVYVGIYIDMVLSIMYPILVRSLLIFFWGELFDNRMTLQVLIIFHD